MFTPFHLEKWYLDCSTEAGDIAICYCARLAGQPISLSYASFLAANGQNKPRQKTSLFNVTQPEQTEGGIAWQSDALECNGLWQPAAKGHDPLPLFESEEGSINWHCMQPLSRVKLAIGDDHYAGLGYAEHLVLTIAPWKLPIDELWWGRFLAKDVYLVWIRWMGAHQLTRLIFNGHVMEDVEISADRICWDKGRLTIANSTTLREGPIFNTALAMVPGLGSLVPPFFRDTHESKWHGRGELQLGAEIIKGWVVHEHVRFR